ncbi:pentapeptide repeat-containing protein [Rhizobium sp. FY34]|uniref:pentapeptide repeat-containing protein n=1 Tax=Rhizobium sp. FY34 TaxID=2562309 RepID=UPI001FEDE10A|nr:pentapeptide repeat-containing protein [Rhizobium sp. FY34]
MLLPVVAVAAGLFILVPSKPSSAVGKCKSEAAQGVDWSQCKKRLLMLNGSVFDGANLSGVDFGMTDLSGSSLKSANLTKASLMRASLARSDATGANFEKTEGHRADFSGIRADRAIFLSAEIQRANFTGAQLHGVDFTKAELGRAIFYKAEIGDTRFSMTNLSRATFHNATFDGPVDFDNAFMFLTRIEGLDLTKATGLKQDQVALACGDQHTKLPQGLSVPDSWPCDDD